VNDHGNTGAIAGERFVDAVIHDFPNELVKTFRPGVADVHARRVPDGLDSFQYFYVFSAIALIGLQRDVPFV